MEHETLDRTMTITVVFIGRMHALIRQYLITGRKHALIKKYALNKRVRLLTRLYGMICIDFELVTCITCTRVSYINIE